MESALRHGVGTALSILTAITGLTGILVAWLADTPAPAGVPTDTWVSIGKYGVGLAVVLKGVQAALTIIGQHFGGNQGIDEIDAGPAPDAIPEG